MTDLDLASPARRTRYRDFWPTSRILRHSAIVLRLPCILGGKSGQCRALLASGSVAHVRWGTLNMEVKQANGGFTHEKPLCSTCPGMLRGVAAGSDRRGKCGKKRICRVEGGRLHPALVTMSPRHLAG